MKKCSTSFVNWETQVGTRLSIHLTLFRTPLNKKTNNHECWEDCGKKANSYMLLVGMKITTATMEINTAIPPPKGPKK